MSGQNHDRTESSASKPEVEHQDQPGPSNLATRTVTDDAELKERLEVSARAENPLAGLRDEDLIRKAEEYCGAHGFISEDDRRVFRLGALISGHGFEWDNIDGLTAEEIAGLEFERDHPYKSLPWTLIGVVVVCALCAAVQGMDETVVNGAQSFYKEAFNIGDPNSQRDSWVLGLVNSAPYMACFAIGCWLTEPLNQRLGRRGTVWLACLISAVACIWQGFTNSWWHMFIARFALGLGIGPKSATTPIFAAECAPPKVRGALTMQWQMWTAFGIMMGYVADLALYRVPDFGIALGLNWRLMMGSACIPAIIVCFVIPFFPESPRWYMTKNRHADAYKAICRMRHHKLQAARDLFYMNIGIQAENEARSAVKQNRFKEFLFVRRNRNAMVASEITMFMQQFCGINVIAYYSSEIFLQANFTQIQALGCSLGFGALNFLFAIPAFYSIDRWGRRPLLLLTFPLMALFLFFTGFSFWIPDDVNSVTRIACIATGIYLFCMVYSPGAGPVPFTYSAEAYPLYIRPIGMSLATATTWFFNFVLAVTWPAMLASFGPQAAFSWYAAWNVVGFFLTLFFVPETKAKSLEELDSVFSVPLRTHAKYGLDQLTYAFNRFALFRTVDKPQVPHESLVLDEKSVPPQRPQDPTARV